MDFLRSPRIEARALLDNAASLIRDRRGNIALAFAILAVPMVGAVGLAIDYSRMLALRSAVERAADSAALFAVKVAKEETVAANGDTSRTAAVLAETKLRAEKMFNASVLEATDGTASATVDITKTGPAFSATVSYDASIRTTFSQVLGQMSMRTTDSVKAISSMPLYTDVSLLLDISQSMGLASTTAGAVALYTETKRIGGQGCTFGCHASAPSFGTATPFSTIAANIGVKLRIDVLRDATKDMIASAKASTGDNAFYRFALYTMSYNFLTLAPLSANLTSVSTKADTIALGYNDKTGFGDTNYASNVPLLLPKVIANGDGLSQATARQFVFIITDGVKDVAGSCTYGHCTGPFDPAECKAFKDKGATVGVIYTTYLPVLENPLNGSTKLEDAYQKLVQPFATQIKPNLKACATDGWFFEASNASEIHDAMEAAFKQIETPPTVTQ